MLRLLRSIVRRKLLPVKLKNETEIHASFSPPSDVLPQVHSSLTLGPNTHVTLCPASHHIFSAPPHSIQEGRVQLHQRAGTSHIHVALIAAYCHSCSILSVISVHLSLCLMCKSSFIQGWYV